MLDEIEKVVGAGHPEQVGKFQYWFDDDRWEWSDELARMHGYEPGAVEPTTALLLSHKHPDDRDRVEADFVTSVRDHAPFSSRHRIIDATGEERHVVVVSDSVTDDAGRVIGTDGYYVDLTDRAAPPADGLFNQAVVELIEHRMVIEQAKGALMLMYHLNADQAFRVLVWRSQETNVRVRDLAAQLASAFDTVTIGAAARSEFDHLLLTVHQRGPHEPEPPADPDTR
ncbi:ANTAR domain-containing protein [Nocardia yunnanensis]|uniref:histidine kinase n=1 Tax=Nocardia yunnanensis TaxID=2382165 RepID=A0A386ZNL6_9NOCA|nr:ANTAR domain-containing protein [Nocardia yunnanensis]